MKPLSGKTALVTGCADPQGIGAAIVHQLAEDGARVIATDMAGTLEVDGENHRRTDLLEQLATRIVNSGGDSQARTLDVTNTSDMQDVINDVLTAHDTIDILVNNAGSLAGSDAFLSTTPQQWTSSFEVNLLGPMMLIQQVLPAMIANGGGRIINIGSTASLGAEPGFGAYTAMKQGLVGLTKTIAAEFGPDGVRCNIVCPGYISTGMHTAANRRIAGEQGRSIEAVKADRYAAVALRDAGMPKDVAQAVAYLAGPNAEYVTGVTLPVSGGVPCGI